jgi:transmembrane sensor
MGNPDSGALAEDADWEALARYLAGESSPEEAAQMRRWLDARPERAELVAAMQRALEPLTESAPSDIDVEGALRRVHARMSADATGAPAARPAVTVVRGDAPRLPPRWHVRAVPAWQRNGLRAAAAVLLVAGAAVVWRTTQPNGASRPADAARRVATSIGERDSVRLTDGSRIVLGPGSALTIAEGFGATVRDVALEGEAYFDVVHDGARPFTVHAGPATIVDVGTTFTVRTDSSTGVRVAVTSGVVQLRRSPADSAAGVLLRAGDVGVMSGAEPMVVARGTTSADDSAFATGRLAFHDAPLSEVSAALKRWYGVDLSVSDSSLARRRLTASFEGEPVERVLSVIGLTLGVDIQRNGTTVIVRPPRRR